MHIALRLVAATLALGAGCLAAITAGPALAPGLVWPLYAGQVRGLIFATVMAAACAGLIWVAVRPVGGNRR